MKKHIEFILRQYNIGAWWGGIRNTISNSTMYLSLFNTAMIVPMAYVTVFAPVFHELGWVVPFWLFAVGIGIGAVVMLVVEYKFLTPSTFMFWSSQFWTHNNPIRKKLNNMEKRMADRMEKQEMRLKRMEEMLENISRK